MVTASFTATLEVTKRLVEVMLTAKMLVGLRAPEIARLMKVPLLAKRLVELKVVKKPLLLLTAPAKRLVELTVLKKPLVEVKAVPAAVLKVKAPAKFALPKMLK